MGALPSLCTREKCIRLHRGPHYHVNDKIVYPTLVEAMRLFRKREPTGHPRLHALTREWRP